jgi:hypothetical protein
MLQSLKCPDASRWQDLLANSSASDSAELEAHLAGCSHCQQLLDDLAVGSSGWLRDANRLARSPDNDLDMTKTLHRLRDELLDEHHELPVPLDFLKPSDQPGVLGTLGRYQVLEVLGRGAFGIVLKALDPELLRPVAIKVLAPYLAPSGTARQRFLREARAAAAVSHDHIVTIHDVVPGDNLPYIVMEYVSGISLQGRLDRDGPLAPAEIARIGLQTANGLAAAHSQGLVHRDIKPANILLENGVERVKITDFGLARAADDARLTQSGVAAGTPLYMSPEQARGEAVDHRSDLFSLGSVLYTLATGFPPFRADSTMGVLNRITNNSPRPIRETIPDFPADLEKIIMQLLEKDPGKRFQLAADVSFKLTGFLSGSPSEPQPPAAVDAEERPEPEQPTKSRVTALVLLAAAAMVAIVLTFKTSKGTLVVEVDDPDIKVALDGEGEELTITGAGTQEVRLKPGTYHVAATKDGKPAKVSQQVVSIAKNGKQVVKVSFQPEPEVESKITHAKKLDWPDVIPRPSGSGLGVPAKKDPRNTMDPEWEAKLDKHMARFMDLKNRLADTSAGSLFLTVGPFADLNNAVAAVKEADREKVKKLLAARDRFSLLVPKAQAAAVQLHRLDDLVANTARQRVTQDLESVYSALSGDLKEMEKLAKELGAKPALPIAADSGTPVVNWEARQRNVIRDFDALIREIGKTRTGSVLLTTPPMADPAKATAGLSDRDAVRVKRLLVLRDQFSVQVDKAHKDLDRWEKATLDFKNKDALHEAGTLSGNEFDQAKLELKQSERALQNTEDAMAALLADLDKIAKELGVAQDADGDRLEGELKQMLGEYEALKLRLAKTTVGRLMATISEDGGWSTLAVKSTVGSDEKMIKQGERLLTLRGELTTQVGKAQTALNERSVRLKSKVESKKEDQIPSIDEAIAKNEQEAKFRIAVIRGLVDDFAKLADEIQGPEKK